MPFTAVYVLTCEGRGRFAAMTLLSASAFRRVHPEGRVVLLTDPPSATALATTFPQLLSGVDEVVALPVDGADLRIRSRALKTRIREAIAGDFVYLDVDTIPIRRFDEIADGDWDIAAVQDRNHFCPIDAVFPHWREKDYCELGWAFPLPKFFNSGVVFYRDSPATHALSREWQKRWRELFAIGREDDDQFALSSAIYAVPGLRIHELPTAYNAMIRAHPRHARGAKVYHFYAGNLEDREGTILEYLLRHYELTATFDWPALDRCAAMGHPWLPPFWPRRLWQTGNRRLAIQTAVLNRLRKRLPASPGKVVS